MCLPSLRTQCLSESKLPPCSSQCPLFLCGKKKQFNDRRFHMDHFHIEEQPVYTEIG